MTVVPFSKHRQWLLGILLIGLTASIFNFYQLETTPPGLDPDAASNGILALQWLRHGTIPFWVPHASAAEPLMIWLQTLTTWLIGPSIIALRSVSASATVLAALVTYGLAYETALHLPEMRRWGMAVLAGLGYATSLALVEIGRTGLRATLLPAFSGFVLWMILRAMHTGQYRYYHLAGIGLGLTAYTYLAARFFPIALAIFSIAVWVLKIRVNWHHHRRGWAQMLGIAALMVAPQIWFYFTYPNTFLERAQSVTLFNNPQFNQIGLGSLLAQKVLNQILMFGVQWSGQYNQSGSPLLPPFLAIGLLVVWPILYKHRREVSVILLISVLLTMLMPDFIWGDRLTPHELRIGGSFVPLFIFSSWGLASVIDWVGQQQKRLTSKVIYACLGVGIIAWQAGVGSLLYIPRLQASNYAWYARSEVAEAEFINARSTPLVLPLSEYSRPIIHYLTSATVNSIASGVDISGQVQPPMSDTITAIWPENVTRGRSEATSYRYDAEALVVIDSHRAWLMPPQLTQWSALVHACKPQAILTPTLQQAAVACSLGWQAIQFPATVGPTWPIKASYPAGFDLHGVTADTTEIKAYQILGVSSMWQATSHPLANYRYFVQLLDDQQQRLTGEDLVPGYGLYPTTIWEKEQPILIRQLLQLPKSLPPGRYWLMVGWYDPFTGERLSTDTGETQVIVGPLKVPLAAPNSLPKETKSFAQFDDQLTLGGFYVQPFNDRWQVDLRWQAIRPPEQDYTLFLHLENSQGEIIAQIDTQPLNNTYPTGIWGVGESVLMNLSLPVPAGLSGSYKLWVGWYYWQTGERLTVKSDDGEVVDNRLLLLTTELP